ncbi:chain-length determining protein [Spirosoma daeguense]
MSVSENKKEIADARELEIRLEDLLNFLKKNLRRILIGVIVGMFLGGIYAFTKPNLYKATVTLMPEIQNRGAGGLSGIGSLAGMAGLNIDNLGTQDAVRPDLYPNVIKSIPFALDLLKQKVYSKNFKAQMTLQEFLTKTAGWSFASLLGNIFAGKGDDSEVAPNKTVGTLELTKEQDVLVKSVLASIDPAYDKKTSMLTLTAIETDPIVAANVSRLAMDYLTNYVTAYRTEKSRRQVSFLQQRVDEAKNRYQAAEYAISNYRDRNRSLFLETAKITEQRLQADYLLEQTVYNELSKQLEQAKIKVQEETPVFKILEPPTIPLRKSSPSRTLIVLIGGFLGAIVSVVIALIRTKHNLIRFV